MEDASYIKLRELTVNFRIGQVGGSGDWKIGVVGRNLKTWTDFRGFDPEAGNPTGPLNSSALTPVAGFRFPNLRTYTVQISTSFKGRCKQPVRASRESVAARPHLPFSLQ